jgi:hypothetical protein
MQKYFQLIFEIFLRRTGEALAAQDAHRSHPLPLDTTPGLTVAEAQQNKTPSFFENEIPIP